MHIITELFHVERCQTKLKSDFSKGKHQWEQVNNASEESKIENGFYWMKNKSPHNWHYFKTKSPVYHFENVVFDTSIELDSKNEHGHFGLVWGFDKNMEVLNRFSLSADGERLLIMQFQKDHEKIFHRFHKRVTPKINMNQPVRFTIIKMGNYFHFLINQKNMYICHESQFNNNDQFVGYYVEPGLHIKSSYFEIKKLTANEMDVFTGLNLLIE